MPFASCAGMLTSHPSFTPPFCPNPACLHHRDPSGWQYHRHGTFERQAPPHVIRRFRCRHCRRCFSTQTFDTTYFLKRPELQQPLMQALTACSALRQASRVLRCHVSTLQRQASRLGRHCLLFEQSRRPAAPPDEALVLDGFVTFEYSQYWPFEINTLVGERSHFVYGFTDSELRRSGRMTAAQKRKRARLELLHGKPAPHATRDAVRALLLLAAPQPAALCVLSDEHQAYPQAMRSLPHRFEHETVSSRRCRTRNNPLFAADLLDLLIRHGSSNHKRETIAFSKRRQGALERMAVLKAWRNRQKRISERRPDSPTPAMALGLETRPLRPEDILDRRLFPSLVPLPQPLGRYYWRDIETRQVPSGTRHALRYAA